MVRLVSVEGNIASGKSTLLANLRERYGQDTRVAFAPEPVSEWEAIRDASGVGMLAKYYDNQRKYAFAFQMMAYISRLSVLRRALRSGADVVITERSVLTDRHVFAHMLHADGALEDVEHAIYTKWFDEFLEDIPAPEIVYVRTSPSTCAHRLAVRARPGEVVPLPYLQSVHDRHEAWLVGPGDDQYRMLTINATPDITENPQVVDEWLSAIDRFVWGPGAHAPASVGDGNSVQQDGMRPGVPPLDRDRHGDWLLRFDGASRGNPGHSAAGWVVWHDGHAKASGGTYLSAQGTNNWAEYQALIAGLTAALRLGATNLVVQGDSKLVVEQVNGRWKTKHPSLIGLRAESVQLMKRLGNVLLEHIPRAQNQAADSLANMALDNELKQLGAGRSFRPV